MSVLIPLDDLTEENKTKIRKCLMIQPKNETYFKTMYDYSNTFEKDPILFYDIQNNKIHLPYTFGNSIMNKHINSSITYPLRKFNFIKTQLRSYQIPIVKEAMKYLRTKGTVILGLSPGMGKTLMSIWLSSKLGGITLILVPLKLVFKGWITTFKMYTDAKIWVHDGKTPKPDHFDVIITMDTMFYKLKPDILSQVQNLVVDEAHMFCTPKRIHCLLGTIPKYIIACTATLERSDDMHAIIHAMCGKHGVFKKSDKKYMVYKMLTGIKVETEKTKMGNTNWPKLVKDLAYHERRNKMIIALVMKNLQHKIMILTWNKSHAYFLCDLIKKKGVTCDVLAGVKSNYKDSQVLVCTAQKAGVGFDEQMACSDWSGTRSNLMLLVGSTKSLASLEQITGRVFRSEYPIIVDFVDDNAINKNHWRIRRKWYLDPCRNGTIINVKKSDVESLLKENNNIDFINYEKI